MKIVTVLMVSSLHMFSSAQLSNLIIGKWRGEDKPDNHSEFYLKEDGLYYGKLIREGNDKKNVGAIIFKKLSYDKKNNLYKGLMSPPDGSMEINAVITFVGPDKLKIVLRKYLMSKTIYFHRIK